ncbi:MAG: hypothetical protein RIM99_18395 [Cyclobacteriaceae bacterium]
MRAFLIVFLSFSFLIGFSQNFVSPGIIAFHSGAFERTIQDMNKAFETSPDMNSDMRSKAYYYRGMSRLNLLKSGKSSAIIGSDPYHAVYNDLTQAVALDTRWKESVDAELSLIYSQLFTSAKQKYDRGVNAETEIEVNRIFGPAITQLEAVKKIRNTFEVNELLGKSHEAIGVMFDQLIDDQNAQAKALSAYKQALEFYEYALEMNPGSIGCIRALAYISYRLGDRERQSRYADMEANIGG